jgi:hypothetical protein
MAIDTRRVVMAAVEAALDDIASAAPKPKDRRRLPTGRAFLLGAGTVTAARLATGPHARQLLGSLQERLASVQERLEEYVEDDEE